MASQVVARDRWPREAEVAGCPADRRAGRLSTEQLENTQARAKDLRDRAFTLTPPPRADAVGKGREAGAAASGAGVFRACRPAEHDDTLAGPAFAERLPPEAVSRLKANLRAFRAWVAEPAFRADDASSAVRRVLESVGPSVQFKADFLMALASVPRGLELFIEAMTDELLDILPEDGPDGLAETADHLVRAQRIWVRLLAFHPDLDGIGRRVTTTRLSGILTLGFHADNLLTVCLMATDGDSDAVAPEILDSLANAAGDYAARYHAAVRDIAEKAAPRIDEYSPFDPSTLADLLALPPYDGRSHDRT